jgi:hypothetical protein
MVKLPSFKSQKEAFLFYLHRMDIDMIDLILDDSYSYFDVPKDIFVNKLRYFKSELEVDLKMYTNQITIYQKDQTSNTYFLSVDIYDFEQEITFKEVDNKIVDINSEFNSKIQKWCPLYWHFGLDERVNFQPSIEYLLQLQNCTNAFEEIVNQQVKIIDYDTIEYWLNKHQLLYDQVKNEILMFKFNDFRKLYELLTDLKELMECSFPAKFALDNFDNTSEDAIQKWKNDYLTLFAGFVEIFEGFFTEYDKLTYIGKNNVVQLASFSNVYLLRYDFLDIKKFRDLYFELTNFSSLEHDPVDFPF